MAIDTAAKRFSIMDFDIPTQPGMVPPSGAVNADGRAALLWLYTGIDLAGGDTNVPAKRRSGPMVRIGRMMGGL